MISERIKEEAAKIEKEIIKIRHQIHQNPELAFNEKDTAKLAASKMKELNLEVETGIYGTGVCALLKNSSEGDKKTKTILLRADMDALPIQEATGLEYESKNRGVMHACGHDAHTAILIGTAVVLNELKDELNGNVKFLFQPAEEEEGGAEGMIKAGVLENPKVDAALGLHVWGSTPKGVVEYRPGPFMASPDRFEIKIIGKGGHAAQPHNCIDPVPIAASVINEIQNIISRRLDPAESAVISICNLHGGETHNVIPNEVVLEGTMRTLKPEIREKIPVWIEEVVAKTTAIYGAEYELEFEYRFPPLINNYEMTEVLKNAAAKIVGEEKLKLAEKPNLGGEDFSYFTEALPACFFFLGIAPSTDELIQHHHPEFNVDDDVLKEGIAILAQTVIDYLNN